MKTAIICEINNFLVKIVKYVSGLMVVVNRPETLEMWQYLMKVVIKHKNDKFLGIPLNMHQV